MHFVLYCDKCDKPFIVHIFSFNIISALTSTNIQSLYMYYACQLQISEAGVY